MNNDRNTSHLIGHIVENISLPSFLETEAGCDLKWLSANKSAICCCPIHNEKKPSFRIKLMANGHWIFYCFGCGVKGNIIHFCKEYYGLRNKSEAIVYICKKFKIKNTEDIILQSLKNVYKKVDGQRKMENANILVSNQCRMLLRKDFAAYQKWVSKAYKRLNTALMDEDIETIEAVGYEASKLIMEGKK